MELQQRELRRHLDWLMTFRVVIITTLMASTFVIELLYRPLLSLKSFYLLAVVTYAMTIAYAVLSRTMHAVLDASVDAFFPIVDHLDDFIDSIEERVFVNFDQAALHDIFSVKRLVLQLRRHLAPQREVFSFLTNRPSALIPPDVQLYYRDIYDHIIRLNEAIDTYRDLVSSVMDSYLTQVSNRLNVVTKGLTVVATLSVPFVVVSGMWGMNFSDIPLSNWPHGFWLMFVIQLGLGGSLIWLLHRRGLV